MGGGASSQATENEKAQTNFFNNLQSQQESQYVNFQDIFNTIKQAYTPIVNAGIGQQGFTPAELASMRTSAAQTSGENYSNAERAVANSAGSSGGAATSSGVVGEEKAGIATAGANANTNAQNQITAADYATGRQNFLQASSILSGEGGQAGSGATGLAEDANGAGSNVTSAINMVDKENAAGSWQSILGGVAGSALDAVTGGLTGDLGTALSTVGSGNWGF
jgi:hypothetical protein